MFKIKNIIILAVLTSFIHCGRIRVEVPEEPTPQTEPSQVTAEETVSQTEPIQAKGEDPLLQTGLTQITGEEATPQVKSFEVVMLGGPLGHIDLSMTSPDLNLCEEIRGKFRKQLCPMEFNLYQNGLDINNAGIKSLEEGVPITLIITREAWGIKFHAKEMDAEKQRKIQSTLEKNFPNVDISFVADDFKDREDPLFLCVLVPERVVAKHSYPLFVKDHGPTDEAEFLRSASRYTLSVYYNNFNFKILEESSSSRFSDLRLKRLNRKGTPLKLSSLDELDPRPGGDKRLCVPPFVVSFCSNLPELEAFLRGEDPEIKLLFSWK